MAQSSRSECVWRKKALSEEELLGVLNNSDASDKDFTSDDYDNNLDFENKNDTSSFDEAGTNSKDISRYISPIVEESNSSDVSRCVSLPAISNTSFVTQPHSSGRERHSLRRGQGHERE
ncbi:uncharacterized protein [Diabrotica undecimpunctata]|uniref:uncharacterized protein n=1 Tax=Diabrotica undecimpunctata TaxID=50387 RepID=UPI003B6323D0